VFKFLTTGNQRIPNQYIKEQLMLLDKVEGNVDSISNRIANVRTWSYVSNKSNWVENQDYWIERTKNLEDKLSDRLHEELTKTFIDKRASVLARGLKQDITFDTEIINDEKVMINKQYIGHLKGLKLELDLKVDALDADIKSLKKAARHNVSPEIIKRINQIIDTGLIELNNDFKIYWKNYPVAKIIPGSDYLNPKIQLVIDEMIENEEKNKLDLFIQEWIQKKINTELKSLIDLKNTRENNSELRALAYHLYENNGVVKRDEVSSYLKKLDQNERKKLRNLGVKFGRYHIFLFKLFKPSSVSLRTLLWKNFNEKNLNLIPPTFGLNFLEEKKPTNKEFMLLCGFESFDKFFVRIDILERLFLMIYNSNSEKKNSDVKLIPEMLNLLGCNKDNFIKLIKKMNYQTYEKENDLYFKYIPARKLPKKNYKTINKDNPFQILKQLNLK
jgi:ATP-dependent RNA helicase SUPV3L1/SUV3